MTEKAISPLRRRLIEDMTIRRLSPKTHYQYIRHVKKFADFLGRSADKATAQDVHRYQLWLAAMRIRGTCDHVLHANSTLVDRVDLATPLSLSSQRLPAPRLLLPRSGLSRSDLVVCWACSVAWR